MKICNAAGDDDDDDDDDILLFKLIRYITCLIN